jgi:putative ABC transport system permease protein
MMLTRLRAWIRPGRWDAELAEEIEAHRALKQAEYERAGMSPHEAAAASRRALGNVTLAREDARRVRFAPWLESCRQDVAYAFRILRRSPAFAAAMVLVMALGIGSTTAVFGLLDALVLRDLPVRDPHRLAYVAHPSFSYPVFTELKRRAPHVFPQLFGWNLEGANVQWSSRLEPAEILMASGEFYETLGIAPALGRFFTVADDRSGGGPDGLVAVISHASWTRRFGRDPSVIGRTVRIDRRVFTIVGVSPAGFFGVAPGLAPELTIPLTVLADRDALEAPTRSWIHLMGRLSDDISVERADAALQQVWPAVLEVTVNPGMPADRRAMYLGRTVTLHSARTGFSRVRNQFEEPLWLLLALVALLLVVATASAANLMLARAVARRRELAVRLAIGAGRWRLVRQMVTEAVVWTALGAGAGVLGASWAGNGLVAMMTTWEDPIALETGLNLRVLSFTAALALLTAMGAAVFPALRASRANAGATLKESSQLTGAAGLRRWSAGKLLVSAQVALTVLLLFGAALFVRSLQRIVEQDAGFDRDVLIVSSDAQAAGYEAERLKAFHAALLERLRTIPGVEAASLSEYPPISDEDGAWTQSIGVDGAPVTQDASRYVYFNAVTPGYFRTIGMRLLAGRDFSDLDTAQSRRVVIVTESLVRRFFPDGDALGRRVSVGRDENRQDLEIVGIVSDAKYQRLQEPTRRIAYLAIRQLPDSMRDENLVAEVRTSGATVAVADRIRQEIGALDTTVPIRIQTINERIRESLVTERVLAMLATTLGLSALALACAALYGLLAYTVSRQAGEIGLRIALGADRATVRWMVLRQSLVLGAVGVIAGVAASFALGGFARNMLYQVSASDPFALAAAAGLMLAIALCAGLLPARRAARVDPVVALRVD